MAKKGTGKVTAVSGGTAGSVKYKWYGDVTSDRIKKAILRRLTKVATLLKTEIKKKISVSSKIFRSIPGEPPRAETRTLAQSIFTHVGESGGTQFAIVGTPKEYARALEFGTRGGITIVPKKKKALSIQITREEAMRIAGRSEYYVKGKRGGAVKRGNSSRARMKRAGIWRTRGKFWLIRARVLRGPLRPRPFFRRTLNEQRRAINKIMKQPMRNLVVKSRRTTPTVRSK